MAYVTLHHRGCTLVPPSTWAKRVPRDGNILILDRFLEKLNDWGMTITEDMDPAAAEKYILKRFRWRLPKVLQGL